MDSCVGIFLGEPLRKGTSLVWTVPVGRLSCDPGADQFAIVRPLYRTVSATSRSEILLHIVLTPSLDLLLRYGVQRHLTQHSL